MIQPTEAIYQLMYAAAQKYGVPLTLLEALAFEFSGFDAKKKLEKAGAETRYGLFGFTTPQLDHYEVMDPFDAAQAIDGAARALADIVKYWTDSPSIVASWYLGSVLKTAHLDNTAPQIPSSNDPPKLDSVPEKWPADVRRYVKKLLRIRYFYQDVGTPRGADSAEHLQNAINALSDLNPGMNPRINAARDAMVQYRESKPVEPLPYDPFLDALKVVWLAYMLAFDVAPITNERTPVPERLNSNWWIAVSKNELWPSLAQTGRKIENAARDAGKALSEAGEKINQALLTGLAVTAALGALWIALNRRRT